MSGGGQSAWVAVTHQHGEREERKGGMGGGGRLCALSLGISHPNPQRKTQKTKQCLREFDFPWESVTGLGFDSGL